MTKFSVRSMMLAGAMVPMMATAAQAQDTAPVDDNVGLEAIVVTAQRRTENLQDVPIAVSAFSSDELTGASIAGSIDLPRLTPNLNFTSHSGFAAAYIRGVGTQFGNPGLESSVSVYMDDVYLPRATSALFQFNDIERIEVLRGPQGTLYGRNATGGAIRIITNNAHDEWEGRAAFTYGSHNTLIAEGMINVPLADGLGFRVAGRHEQNDGYVENLFPGGGATGERNITMQDRNTDMMTAQLRYEGERLTVRLAGDYSMKDDNEGVAHRNLFPGLPEQFGAALGGCVAVEFDDVCSNGQGYMGIEAYGALLRIDYEFDPLTLTSITAFRNENERNCADIDGTGVLVQEVCGRPVTHQYTQEFQARSNSSGPLRWVIGSFFLREFSYYNFSVLAADPSIPPGFGIQSTSDGVRTTSLAPFGQIDYDFSDAFSISAGLRYTAEDKDMLGNRGDLVQIDPTTGFPLPGGIVIPTPASPTGAPCVPGQILCFDPRRDVSFDEISFRLTPSFRPIDDLMIYATWSRGFKSGGFNLPAFGYVDAVEPETLDDYEVGFKYEGDFIRFNAAAFLYDYQDLQISITDQTTGGTRIRNAASAELWGLEGELTWLPVEGLEIGLGGSYLSSKYKDFRGDDYIPCSILPTVDAADAQEQAGIDAGLAACAGQGGLGLALVSGQDFSGNRLVNAPRWTGFGRIQYTIDAGSAGSFQIGGVANYRSLAFWDPGNRYTDPSRWMLSARVTWTSVDEHFFASAWVDNILDEEYYTINSPQNLGGWATAGQPRWFYVSAGVHF